MMRMTSILILVAIFWTQSGWAVQVPTPTRSRTGQTETKDDRVEGRPQKENGTGDQGFELPDLNGSSIRLEPGHKLTLLFFLGTECPLARLYSVRVADLVSQQGSALRVIGVSSNQQDSLDELKKFATEHRIGFPIAKDWENRIADRFRVTRTPEFILLDSRLKIVYRGRFDNQYSPGISRAKASEHYLADAVREVLAGKKVSRARTEPVGCLIGRVRKPATDSSVTWCDQVSRIVYKHCVECHRPGEIGPFPLVDYDEAVGWADMMLEVIEEKRMPPWHANPKHGDFANERIMTSREKDLIRKWVDAGAPYGLRKDLPKLPEFPQGWSLPRKPDQVIRMARHPYNVPEDGIVDYQYFVVDPGFTEDKWISAAQVLPGNRSVVHHSIVFVRPPDGHRFRGIGWLAAYVPGQRANVLPPGHARFVPAGSKLVFQQHYTTTGTPETDMTQIGLVFADPNNVQHEVLTMAGIDQEFEIPPRVENHRVTASVDRLPGRGRVLSLAPHMHLRGKSFKAWKTKDGRKELICDVPAYDFNWQHTYIFRNPLDLREIDGIDLEFIFDNSKANPVNPDPDRLVAWGDQTDEEMAVLFLDVAVPRNGLPGAEPIERKNSKPIAGKAANDKPGAHPEVSNFVERFFHRFDRNGDGKVSREETPVSLRGFGFWQYDTNRDGFLDRDEVTKAAAARLKPRQ